MSDKDKVADSLERFKLAYDNESENRRLALEDMRFSLLAEQWDPAVLKQRQLENRPALTINRMQAIGRQVVNDARQNKPAIKCRPVDSNGDVKVAGIYDGLIRNIEQTSNASVAYDTGIECAVYGGFGYWRIKTDYAHDDSFDLDLCIDRIANPFSVYGCPHSLAADASDWMQAHIVTVMSHEAFKRKYKGAEIVDWQGNDEKVSLWVTEDTVQVAEEWLREEVTRKIVKLSTGEVIEADQYRKNKQLFDAAQIVVVGEREARTYKVTQRILSGAEVLEDTTEWAGRYIPICPIYGDEINIEGKRYFKSLIRDAKDAQRMLNYWRTTSTELVALAPRAPWVGPVGSFKTDRRWETANTANHAYLEYDVTGNSPPQRQPFAGVPAGALQEAMNASDDIKSITGLYDASLGARSNETSGRAIMARQREGDTATFHFIDNQQRAIRYTGRVLIDLIPKVFDQQRMVRVLGEDGKAEVIEVNNGLLDLARGKYDLVVHSGPSYTTKREEFANVMTEFTRSNPATFPMVADKLVVAMDFPDAETIAKRFQMMLPQQIQQMESQGQQDPEKMAPMLMAQLQQAQAQIQQMQQAMQEMQPERAKLQIEGQKAQQEGQIKAMEMQMAEREAAMKAEIDRQKLALDAEKLALEREKFIAEQMRAQQESEKAHKEELASSGGGLVSEGDPETGEEPMTLAQHMAAISQQNMQAQMAMMQTLQGIQQAMAALSAPKRAVRGPDGKIVGVEVVQ